MPTFLLESSHGLARTLFYKFQSSTPNPFDNDRLFVGVLVDEMRSVLLHGYDGIHHAISRYIPHTDPAPAVPELSDLESQHPNYQEVTNTGRGPGIDPLNPFPDVNNGSTSDHIAASHSASESDDSAAESDQTAEHREHGSHNKSLKFPKRIWTWKVTFVFGVLSVIVVPGLVVGVMTGQMSWGIELSGAIAPIVSLLAGLYYHTKK